MQPVMIAQETPFREVADTGANKLCVLLTPRLSPARRPPPKRTARRIRFSLDEMKEKDFDYNHVHDTRAAVY